MREVLQNRQFRRLWFAQVTLALGDALMRMGLLEFFQAHGYDWDIEAAKMLFAFTLPGVVLGPVAIAYLDKWQRRSVLMLSDALRAVVVLVIAAWLLPVLTGRIEQRGLLTVYAMLFVIGSITTFYFPARYALLSNLVEPDRLIQANTIFTTSLAVANIGGLPVGGFVAERMGVEWAVLANALAYVASIGLVWSIRMQPHATTRGIDAHPRGGWGELKTGLQYLWRHPTAMTLAVLAALFAFLAGILVVVVAGYARTLGLRTVELGWLFAAAGLGAAAGVVTMGRGGPWTRWRWLPFVQLTVAGAVLVLLSVSTRAWLAAPLLAILGAVGATAIIPIDSKLQEQVEDKRRGAVFAARGILTSSTMLVAFWLRFGTTPLRHAAPAKILMWLGIGSIVAAIVGALPVWVRARTARPRESL
jgi:DHA3 family macrolide efflux protein-like MFS transporter